MVELGGCPRCHREISQERKLSNPVICDHCGFVITKSGYEAQEKLDQTFMRLAFGLAVFMIAGFLQLSIWDNHALEVVPLEAKELIGASSNSDIERFAEICLERKKLDCVEREYSKLGERDNSQLLRLGKFQMQRARYAEAVNSYRTYFTKGGIDLEGSYQFARALGQVGMVDEAAKYYDYVLGAKPDVLQVTVIQNYVRLLMDAHRLDRAKQLIEGVRSKSAASAYFMDDDYKKIQAAGGAKS